MSFCFHRDSWGNDPIRLANIFQKGWFIQQLVGFGDSRPLNCSFIVIPIDILIELFIPVLEKRKASKYPNNCRREMRFIVRRPFLTWPFWWSFDEVDLFEQFAAIYWWSRWWFQIFLYLHPYLGTISNLTYIFQMVWFHNLTRAGPPQSWMNL